MQKLSLVISVCALLLVACNSQKGPAEAAFAQIQASVAPVSADLEKYAPDEYAQLSAQIDDMKAKLNARDYAAALAARTAVMAKLVAVSGVAGKHKNELAAQLSGDWRALSASVPGMLAQLGTRISNLQGAAKLPANVSAAALAQAKQSVSELNMEWSAALDAMQARDIATAVAKAHAIDKRAAELGSMLGVKASG